jgi:hypothetical protein
MVGNGDKWDGAKAIIELTFNSAKASCQSCCAWCFATCCKCALVPH